MLSKDNEILDIDDAVTPGHWANIAQRLVCAPVVHHEAQVSGVDHTIAIEVDDGDNRCLPYV